MGKVLVTDGNQRSTLAVVRSLGLSGIEVTVADDVQPCLASSSRYCVERWLYPSPRKSPDQFIDTLERKLAEGGFDLLIPMTDITCILIDQYRDRLKPYVKIALTDSESFRMAQDKGDLISLCHTLGIPAPKTWFVENTSELQMLVNELSFPVVIKPRRSRTLTDTGWVDGGIGYAQNEMELEAALANWPDDLPLPVIQERITGPGVGAFLLCDRGDPKALFFHRRIREKPPSGGVSVVREAAPVDPRLKDYAERMLRAMSWHGVAMVEFKHDSSDGLPKIMEINGRFWGSLQLAIDAGVNFPCLLYSLETGESIEPITEYNEGIRLRWLLGDFDHLLARLTKSAKRLNLPEDAPSRWRTLIEFLKFCKRGQNYEIVKFHDPGPAGYELRAYIGGLIRSIFRKRSRRKI
jgi:predicted ATP-grasp superfamily ATP-dependent carboligase